MLEFVQLTDEEYASFQENHPCGQFLNTPEAMQVKLVDGWDVEYVGVKKDGQLVCATNLTSIPVMKIYRYYRAQRGYLMDYSDTEVLKFFTKELKSYLHAKKGLYLEMDPNVFHKERDIDGNVVEGGYDHSEVVRKLQKLGYEHEGFTVGYEDGDPRWIFTLLINGRSEQELLKSFHQQTRWSINKTIKQGIKVRELGLDEVSIFLNMMHETAERRGFAKREDEWYVRQIEAFKDKGKLLLAYLDIPDFLQSLDQEKADLDKEMADIQQKLEEIPNSKKFVKKQRVVQEALDLNLKKRNEALEMQEQYGPVINMATSLFLIGNGEIVYMHSATDDTFRKYNAPYAIHWYMIRYAIAHGYNRYNFYGISGIFDKEDESYGVYDFKRGFTGVVEEYIGFFTLPISDMMYKMYKKLKG